MKKTFRSQPILLLSAIVASTLAACGGDSGSSSNNSDTDSVASLEELPHCTKSHYGEIVHVEETDSLYECTSKGWVTADTSSIDTSSTNSSDKSSSSSKQSSSSKKNSSDSKSSSSAKSSSSIKVEESDIEKIEALPVDSVNISGWAQKGPFVSGSTVTAYTLDSALNTGKVKFTGKTAGDSGRYSINNVSQESQYAELEASGFFKSEITGKNSSGTKTKLHAIVDLSEGKKVKANLNIFTELEAARTRVLVKKKDFNVPAAKKRATHELVDIFGAGFSGKKLTDEDFKKFSSTDISLADTTQAGAALYAASIILLTDKSSSRFSAFLATVADSFAATGTWNDAEARTEIADYLFDKETSDNFASFRANAKAMKLGPKIPDFESILRNFWESAYGLPECTSSNEDALEKNSNKKSENYKNGYICSNKRWTKASKLETELGLCNKKTNGDYVTSESGDHYLCKEDSWESISDLEFELGACNKEVESGSSQYKKIDAQYFMCKNNTWEEIDADSYKLQNCTKSREDEYQNINDKYYYCHDTTWHNISKIEYDLKTCADSTEGHFQNIGRSYVCTENNWIRCSSEYEYKLVGEYYCDRNSGESGNEYSWRTLIDIEKKFGVCTPETKDSVIWTGSVVEKEELEKYVKKLPPDTTKSGEFLECNGSKWVQSTGVRYIYGTTCTDNEVKSLLDTNIILKLTGTTEVVADTFMAQAVLVMLYYNTISSINGKAVTYVGCKNNDWIETDSKSHDLNRVCNYSTYRDVLKDKNDQLYRCLYYNPNYSWEKVIKDSRDTNYYKIVTIGTQTWMAENLNFYYENRPEIHVDTAKCYRDSLKYCKDYGRLYKWSMAMDSSAQYSANGKGCGYESKSCSYTKPARGICPENWHLPSNEEFQTLYDYVDSRNGSETVGESLRATDTWVYDGVSHNGTNRFGFTAFNAGYIKYTSPNYGHSKIFTGFWASDTTNTAWELDNSSHLDLEKRKREGIFYFPIRCIKDEDK